ncbi:hypothetical protein F5Y15DRAFT_127853 [Xylariaceae sp. FL0016]|nr:hypothetical protein F5Y15DRAFT_127853 [Xylariaceae sp. FL0016]
MIGTSLPEYVFIRVCIILLQYTTPLCLICLTILIAVRGTSAALAMPISQVLVAYSVVDLLYALFVYYPYKLKLKQEAKHPTPLSRAERRELFHRVHHNIPELERYLHIWFLGADEGEIRRENVRDFILWAFFDRWPGQESPDDEAELDEYLATIEQRIGRSLEPGRGKATGLRLTLDEVETRYRSVLWYFIVGIVDLATHFMMVWLGFQHHGQSRSNLLSVTPPRFQSFFSGKRSPSPRLTYWHRRHTATDKLPVLFLHGIGIGLSTYVPYLSRLDSTQDRGQTGIIAIEILPISFRLTDAPLNKLEFLENIGSILNAHGWDRFVLAAHSYGTVLATHLLRSPALSPQVDSVLLIDPVSILLHLPDVAYNFTRRKPRKANEWMLWYFASMDPGVAHCLGRHFFWKENIAWKEDLVQVAGDIPADGNGVEDRGRHPKGQTRQVAVCLSERDLIVDTRMVAQYLAGDKDWISSGNEPWQSRSLTSTNHDVEPVPHHRTRDGVEIFWFPGLDHAQAFDVKRYRDCLCAITRRYCAG